MLTLRMSASDLQVGCVRRAFYVIVIAMLGAEVYGARILCIFPAASRSHIIVYEPLTRELAARGHHVTVISSFAQKEPLANYTDIELPELYHGLEKHANSIYDLRNPPVIKSLLLYWELINKRCEYFLNDSRIQELINSQDKQFDLIIFETLFYECFLGFSHKYRAPVIGIYANRGTHWMWDIVGNSAPFSYVPSLDFAFSDHMTFAERLVNTVSITAFNVIRNAVLLPRYDLLMRKYFNDSTIPYVKVLENNINLLLLTHHERLDYPKPVVPAIINVGGLHIKPPKKLPQELQTFLDKARHGVVYFSLGSNLKSSLIPESLEKVFVGVFSKLKQRVLWAWDKETTTDLPSNVMVGKWLPQLDVLAHPNVRVFLTHGGYLGMMESAYHGVPFVGVPIFADHFWNVRLAQEMGFGIKLELENVTTQSLMWAINTCIYKSRYRKQARLASVKLRDEIQTPLEKAVYWTEYVLRHNGARHLRVAAVDLTWSQYLMLDVVGMLAAPFLLFAVVYMAIRTFPKRSLQDGVQTEHQVKTQTQ